MKAYMLLMAIGVYTILAVFGIIFIVADMSGAIQQRVVLNWLDIIVIGIGSLFVYVFTMYIVEKIREEI